ncbi:unnamed protein product, partial [Medioppia subpectinata]
ETPNRIHMPIVFVNQSQHHQHVQHQAPPPPTAPAPQPPLILRQQLLQQQPSRHQYYPNDQTISANKTSMEAIKICVVCGDRANGYNFNVIACESCKAFFRRNALRKKDFKCPFNGNCKIDAITRKFCQKCRLQKCFNSGMKKVSTHALYIHVYTIFPVLMMSVLVVVVLVLVLVVLVLS